MTWSTVKFERAPQYWHVHPSRANTARRVILRRCVSRGTFTYVTRRITIGRGIVVCSERRAHAACSMHLRLLLQQQHGRAPNRADVDRLVRRVEDEHPSSSTFTPPVLSERREPDWGWWRQWPCAAAV